MPHSDGSRASPTSEPVAAVTRWWIWWLPKQSPQQAATAVDAATVAGKTQDVATVGAAAGDIAETADEWLLPGSCMTGQVGPG